MANEPQSDAAFTELCRALTESLRRQLDSAQRGEHLGIRSTASPESSLFTSDHLDIVLALRAEHRASLKSYQQMPVREGDETPPPTFSDFLYSKGQSALGDMFVLVQHGWFQDQ